MKLRHTTSSERAAFSLVELMVVILIISLLATLVVPNVIGRLKIAREKIAQGQLALIKESLDLYLLDHGTYPGSLDVLVVEEGDRPRYLEKRVVPLDPWENAYHYQPPRDSSSELVLCSFGSDGRPGGTGTAADIHWDPGA